MLDLYVEDPLWVGMRLGVANVVSFKLCCVPGQTTVEMASICLYESMDCGSLFDQQLDGFEFEDIKACCTPGNTTIGEATECLYPSHFGIDGSLKCWVHDAASGMGYSVPTGFGNGEDSVCISLCWDCGTSTANDGICTEDQVTAEAKISVNSISSRQYLGTYENAYATYGFML